MARKQVQRTPAHEGVIHQLFQGCLEDTHNHQIKNLREYFIFIEASGAMTRYACMTNSLPCTQKSSRPFPVLLAYPRVYQRLTAPDPREDFQKVLDKCYQLARHRPTPENQHGGFFGLGGPGDKTMLGLFTIWANQADAPDIFIIHGWGDGFGPGHTCPTKEELRGGLYGNLIQIPFL